MALKYFFREVYLNMKRNVLMNLASVTTVMILSIMLCFFYISILNLNFWAENIVNQLQIVAVLKDSTPKAKIKQIYQIISRLPEVKSLEYISKEEALHRLQQKLKMDISLTDLPNNPLPNTFEIQLNNADKISRLAEAIKKMDYIEKVKYGEKIANKVLALNRAVHWTGSLVIIALLVCTVFIISNTIRLTVYARRREIKIMQLVGAAFWFIRWPFIMEGMLQGVMGALPALLLVAGLYGLFVPQVQNNLPFIPLLPLAVIFSKMTAVALITGVAVGGLGSLISVNKYLQYE